jgi:hypothetical protein
MSILGSVKKSTWAITEIPFTHCPCSHSYLVGYLLSIVGVSCCYLELTPSMEVSRKAQFPGFLTGQFSPPRVTFQEPQAEAAYYLVSEVLEHHIHSVLAIQHITQASKGGELDSTS